MVKMGKDYDASCDDLKSEVERIEHMINSPEVRNLRVRTRETLGYVRPRNASTMILLDGSAEDPRVLMGKRNKNLKFMPGALVFPGGSVDRYDGSVPVAEELTKSTEERLARSMRGKPTRRGARALGIAAIREMAEESGILIGQKRDFECDHPDWAIFQQNKVQPALSGLRLFARAITPPGMARRFDTWFFLAHAEEIGHTPANGFEPSGELEELQWIRPEDAITQNTREITRVMLVELIQRLRRDRSLADHYPAPFYRTVNARFHKSLI